MVKARPPQRQASENDVSPVPIMKPASTAVPGRVATTGRSSTRRLPAGVAAVGPDVAANGRAFNDEQDYLLVTLKNGMQVLVISRAKPPPKVALQTSKAVKASLARRASARRASARRASARPRLAVGGGNKREALKESNRTMHSCNSLEFGDDLSLEQFKPMDDSTASSPSPSHRRGGASTVASGIMAKARGSLMSIIDMGGIFSRESSESSGGKDEQMTDESKRLSKGFARGTKGEHIRAPSRAAHSDSTTSTTSSSSSRHYRKNGHSTTASDASGASASKSKAAPAANAPDASGAGDADGAAASGTRNMVAASLTVGCGYFDDPADRAGLAHFLEHLVFMGSANVDANNEFRSYLSKIGGSTNAVTMAEKTEFRFSCPQNALKQALGMFADCFANPLLKSEAAKRELEAIESEFAIARSREQVQLNLVRAATCLPDSPFRKFNYGNKASLLRTHEPGQDPFEALTHDVRRFHNEKYVAPNMRLCIMGAEPVNDLLAIVVETFGQVRAAPLTVARSYPLPPPRSIPGQKKKHKQAAPFYPKSAADIEWAAESDYSTKYMPYSAQTAPPGMLGKHPTKQQLLWYRDSVLCGRTLGNAFFVDSDTTGFHCLHLSWQFPSQLPCYRSSAANYIGHLLGHEANGSLSQVVKDRGLATYLMAGVTPVNSFGSSALFSMFTVSIVLTDDGMAVWHDIASYVFGYLALLRSVGPQREVFDEIVRAGNLSQKFSESSSPTKFVSSLSCRMQPKSGVASKDILRGPMADTWDPDAVKRMLNHLAPVHCRAEITSNIFSGNSLRCGSHTTSRVKSVLAALRGDVLAMSDCSAPILRGDIPPPLPRGAEALNKMNPGGETGQAPTRPSSTGTKRPPFPANLISDSSSSNRRIKNRVKVCMAGVEPHTQVRFWAAPLPDQLMQRWNTALHKGLPAHHGVTFQLPSRNPFIPQAVELQPEEPYVRCKPFLCRLAELEPVLGGSAVPAASPPTCRRSDVMVVVFGMLRIRGGGNHVLDQRTLDPDTKASTLSFAVKHILGKGMEQGTVSSLVLIRSSLARPPAAFVPVSASAAKRHNKNKNKGEDVDGGDDDDDDITEEQCAAEAVALLSKSGEAKMEHLKEGITALGIRKAKNPAKLHSLSQDDLLAFYFLQDTRFSTARVWFRMAIFSPHLCESPLNAAHADVFVRLLEESMAHDIYDAALASMSVKFVIDEGCLSVLCSGFPQALQAFVSRILKNLLSCVRVGLGRIGGGGGGSSSASGSPSSSSSSSSGNGSGSSGSGGRRPSNNSGNKTSVKDRLRAHVAVLHSEYNVKSSRSMKEDMLLSNSWTMEAKKAVLTKITTRSIDEFARRVFAYCHIRALMYGNATSKDAFDVHGDMCRRLREASILPCQMPPVSVYKLRVRALDSVGERNLKVQDLSRAIDAKTSIPREWRLRGMMNIFSRSYESTSVIVYFQIPNASHETRVWTHLCEMLVKEQLFYELRTRAQIGYVVSCHSKSLHDTTSLTFVVQSHKADAITICYLLDVFFANVFRPTVAAMSNEAFADQLEALAVVLKESNSSPGAQVERFWQEVMRSSLDHAPTWNREDAVAGLTLESARALAQQGGGGKTKSAAAAKFDTAWFLKMFDKFLSPYSPSRRQLTHFIVGFRTVSALSGKLAKFQDTYVADPASFDGFKTTAVTKYRMRSTGNSTGASAHVEKVRPPVIPAAARRDGAGCVVM